MNYRLAKPSDAPVLTRMWADLIEKGKYPGLSASDVERERFFAAVVSNMIQSDRFIAVACFKQDVVGFIMTRMVTEAYGSSELVGRCMYLYVEKPYRGKGVGKKLRELAYEFGNQAGVTRVDFDIKYDPAMVEVYKRLGYEPSTIKMTRSVNG